MKFFFIKPNIVISLIFILRKKQKVIYILALLFYTEPILDIFFFDTL